MRSLLVVCSQPEVSENKSRIGRRHSWDRFAVFSPGVGGVPCEEGEGVPDRRAKQSEASP